MPTKGFPHRAIPSGWFQVGWSDELGEPGGGLVKSMRYFAKDLVMYRGASGQVVVLDAYCKHMGAHLGHGGKVNGDCIECPYHGWRWNDTGQNVKIPYSDHTSAARIRHWPVQELGGLIMVWYHPEGLSPQWQLPAIPETSDPAFYPVSSHCYHHWSNLQMPAQLVTENAVDGVHFKYVHGNSDIGVAESYSAENEVFKAVTKLTFGGGRDKTWLTPNGPVEGVQQFDVYGLGLFLTRFPDTDNSLQIDCATPIDIDTSDRRITLVTLRNGDAGNTPTGNAERRVRSSIKLAAQDFPIWENMTYRTHPLLTKEEAAPQLAVRKWARQFYPASALNAIALKQVAAQAS